MNPLWFQQHHNHDNERYHTSCTSKASDSIGFILSCRRLRTIQLHSRQGLAALDKGCPFNISSNYQLFNQCGAGRSSKQPAGRTAMLPIIHARIERGKRFRRSSPRGSHPRIAGTARRPGKARRKGFVSCGSSRGSSIGRA